MTLAQQSVRGASFISAHNYSRGFAKGIPETLKFRAPLDYIHPPMHSERTDFL